MSSGHRADISFGGQVYYSLVLDFIENRKYVDYVLELSIAKDGGPASRVVSAEGSRAVLTTAKTHQLRIPEEEDLIQSARLSSGSGIGFDIIPE